MPKLLRRKPQPESSRRRPTIARVLAHRRRSTAKLVPRRERTQRPRRRSTRLPSPTNRHNRRGMRRRAAKTQAHSVRLSRRINHPAMQKHPPASHSQSRTHETRQPPRLPLPTSDETRSPKPQTPSLHKNKPGSRTRKRRPTPNRPHTRSSRHTPQRRHTQRLHLPLRPNHIRTSTPRDRRMPQTDASPQRKQTTSCPTLSDLTDAHRRSTLPPSLAGVSSVGGGPIGRSAAELVRTWLRLGRSRGG